MIFIFTQSVIYRASFICESVRAGFIGKRRHPDQLWDGRLEEITEISDRHKQQHKRRAFDRNVQERF